MSTVSPRGGEASLRRRLHGLEPAAPPAWLLTTAFAVAYVIVAPISSDLAAAGYRSELVSRAGLTLWDNGWYGGHHLLAYSVLAPVFGLLTTQRHSNGIRALLSENGGLCETVIGCFLCRSTRKMKNEREKSQTCMGNPSPPYPTTISSTPPKCYIEADATISRRGGSS